MKEKLFPGQRDLTHVERKWHASEQKLAQRNNSISAKDSNEKRASCSSLGLTRWDIFCWEEKKNCKINLPRCAWVYRRLCKSFMYRSPLALTPSRSKVVFRPSASNPSSHVQSQCATGNAASTFQPPDRVRHNVQTHTAARLLASFHTQTSQEGISEVFPWDWSWGPALSLAVLRSNVIHLVSKAGSFSRFLILWTTMIGKE